MVTMFGKELLVHNCSQHYVLVLCVVSPQGNVERVASSRKGLN
jgi:hypothetical protein